MSINEVFSQYNEQIDLLEGYLLTLWVKVKVLSKVCVLFQQGFGSLGVARCSAPVKGMRLEKQGSFWISIRRPDNKWLNKIAISIR